LLFYLLEKAVAVVFVIAVVAVLSSRGVPLVQSRTACATAVASRVAQCPPVWLLWWWRALLLCTVDTFINARHTFACAPSAGL
jgi:hypothetical protein